MPRGACYSTAASATKGHREKPHAREFFPLPASRGWPAGSNPWKINRLASMCSLAVVAHNTTTHTFETRSQILLERV